MILSAWTMKGSSPDKPERRKRRGMPPKTASSMTGAAVALLSWVLRPISLMG